jgi:hypothetical protein
VAAVDCSRARRENVMNKAPSGVAGKTCKHRPCSRQVTAGQPGHRTVRRSGRRHVIQRVQQHADQGDFVAPWFIRP